MAELKTVGVKDLKNNLSAYLREVRRGTRVLVTDRNAIVAELHEPGARYDAALSTDPILTGWVDSGVVRLPSRPKSPLPTSPVSLPDGTARVLLDEDRDEGGR